MARAKKESSYVSLKMEKEIADRLNQFLEDSGLTKTKTIEMALNDFMDEYYRKQEILKQLNK
ncbi:hypothetical protein [uncultured Clostridium sp.]|jgi:hypothetical protein|uniref:hypothetical protein n=1 Tax=uncultured Clostridium sp. TaxID=59620 RepID=UPI0025F64C0B|nr:hypothetical protein [uncultured Clostridium sp.]